MCGKGKIRTLSKPSIINASVIGDPRRGCVRVVGQAGKHRRDSVAGRKGSRGWLIFNFRSVVF